MQNTEKIIEIGKSNGGYVVGQEIVGMGIPTVCLTRMIRSGDLSKIAPGVYMIDGYLEDDYYTISLRFGGAVFSRRTAPYLNEMTNRQVEHIEVNFPISYRTAPINGLKFFRTNKLLYELGKTVVTTPLGNKVNSYNVERCLCDLFYYDDFDIEEKAYAVKAVDRVKLNYDRLFDYATKMKIFP